MEEVIDPKFFDKEMADFLKNALVDGETYQYNHAPSYRSIKTGAFVNDRLKNAIYIITRYNEVNAQDLLKDLNEQKQEFENVIPLVHKGIFYRRLHKQHEQLYKDIKRIIELSDVELAVTEYMKKNANENLDSKVPDIYYFNPYGKSGGKIEGFRLSKHEVQKGLDFHTDNVVDYQEIPGEGPRYKVLKLTDFYNNISLENNMFISHH